MKRNIKLTIEYDGTNYCGWQIQNNAISIQEIIERAIKKLTDETLSITGSGRTDTKVHAFGQVANFFTESTIPADKFRVALNCVLPDDIAIRESIEVDHHFHSRHLAIGKEYKYFIYASEVRSPIKRNYSCFVRDNLNTEHMSKALECFVGTHDFSGFMSTGSSVKTTVRTIYEASLIVRDEVIEITIRGNGFLYNMVRIIVGTLIDVGTGKIDYNSMGEIIESTNRKRAGATAPAEGLFLSKVFY